MELSPEFSKDLNHAVDASLKRRTYGGEEPCNFLVLVPPTTAGWAGVAFRAVASFILVPCMNKSTDAERSRQRDSSK